MTVTPPRWAVLEEADRIVSAGLLGDTDDPDLRFLAHAYRIRERQAKAAHDLRAGWEKIKLSPFFKLYCFYAFMILASYLVPVLQRWAAKRRGSAVASRAMHRPQ